MYRMFADDQLLYDANFDKYLLGNPKFKVEVNTCGEASFDIYPTHPRYSSLQKLRTVIQIEESGEVVFRGRIVDDGKDINTIKRIDCEGILAYANDSIVPPFTFPDDFNTSGSDNVVKFFLNWLISNHNSQVQDFQKFKLGTVTVTDPNNYIVRSSEDYKSTWEILSGKLFNSTLGGYLVMRYENDGNYIDYLSDFTTENVQDIVFGQNIIDMKMTDDASEFYTAILPRGSKLKEQEVDEEGNVTETETGERLTIEGLSDGLVTDGVYKKGAYLYKPDLVEKYGWILAPVAETTWDDVNELNYLRINALAYFKGVDAFNGTIEVNAFDLHYSDSKISSFRVNKYVHCVLEPHGIDVRTVLSGMEVDLADVQNTKITVGKTKRGLIDEQTSNYNSLKDQVSELPATIKKDTESTLTYKLVNYYTKTETDAVVKDTKDEWSRTMTSKTEEVKQYAAQVASDAESNANSATDAKLKSYTKTADMQTYVKQTAESITTEATKTLVTKSDFDDLEIGGRNLLPKTATNIPLGAYSGANITKFVNQTVSEWNCQKDAFRFIGTGGTNTIFATYTLMANTLLSAGDMYAASIFVKNNSDNKLTIREGNSGKVIALAKGESKRCTFTINAVTSRHIQFNFQTDSSGLTFDFYAWHPQLERGNKVTDWTPALEDVSDDAASKANSAKNDAIADTVEKLKPYSTTEQMNSAIKQSADSISTTVSKKVGKDEVVSSINQSAEKIAIKASKIDLNGAVSANSYFTIGENGVVGINAGSIELTDAWTGTKLGAKTTIDSTGLYTEQVLNDLAVDFRGNLFSGVLLYPSGKSDLSDYNCLVINRDVITLGKGTNQASILLKPEVGGAIIINKGSSPYSMSFTGTDGKYSKICSSSIYTGGSLMVSGTKNRAVETDHFGTVLQNALETPVPTFADYGEAKLDETGYIRIFLDEIFAETIDLKTIYNVFLTKYGAGDVWVADRQAGFFDVKGTPGLNFSWMIAATQKAYNTTRLERYSDDIDISDYLINTEEENVEEFTNELNEWEGDFYEESDIYYNI